MQDCGQSTETASLSMEVDDNVPMSGQYRQAPLLPVMDESVNPVVMLKRLDVQKSVCSLSVSMVSAPLHLSSSFTILSSLGLLRFYYSISGSVLVGFHRKLQFWFFPGFGFYMKYRCKANH